MATLTDDELTTALRAALVLPGHDEWDAIVQAAGSRRSRRPRRRLALVALVALVALALTIVAASALGVTPKPSIFTWRFTTTTDPHVLVRTHAVDGTTPLTLSGHGDADRFCYTVTLGARELTSSCGQVRRGTVGTWMLGEHQLPHSIKAAGFVMAGIAPPPTVAVRLSFRDGTARELATHQQGWLVDLPPRIFEYGHDPIRIETLDAAGRSIVSRPIHFITPSVRPAAALPVVATVAGRALRAGPSSIGTICVRLLRADGIGANSCPGGPNGVGSLNKETTAYAVRLGPAGKPGVLALVGPLARGASARVTLKDGTHVRARRHGDAFLLVVPGEDRNPPTQLDVVSAGGNVTGTTSLRGPMAGGLYGAAWHGARYPIVTFGAFNSLNYMVGRIQWPDGHITPRGPGQRREG